MSRVRREEAVVNDGLKPEDLPCSGYTPSMPDLKKLNQRELALLGGAVNRNGLDKLHGVQGEGIATGNYRNKW